MCSLSEEWTMQRKSEVIVLTLHASQESNIFVWSYRLCSDSSILEGPLFIYDYEDDNFLLVNLLLCCCMPLVPKYMIMMILGYFLLHKWKIIARTKGLVATTRQRCCYSSICLLLSWKWSHDCDWDGAPLSVIARVCKDNHLLQVKACGVVVSTESDILP